MQVFIYLQVPEYTKQYLLHHFSEDGISIQPKRRGLIRDYLENALRKRQSNFSKEEKGNLPLQLPNFPTKQLVCYNYLDSKHRNYLEKMLWRIMFVDFWNYIMANYTAMKGDKRKRGKENSFQNCTLKWFDQNGITYTEEAFIRMRTEYFREKERLNENHNIRL